MKVYDNKHNPPIVDNFLPITIKSPLFLRNGETTWRLDE